MLDEEIIKKRKELDESIEKNRNYDITYKLSVELDDLIAQFYKIKIGQDNKKTQDKRKVLYMV